MKTGQQKTQNFTIGWSRVPGTQQSASPDDFMKDIVGTPTPPPATSCDGQCELSTKAYGNGWMSNTPSATGLYRVSLDVTSAYTGQACTQKTAASDPNAPPQPCDGYMGTINGKTVCAGPVGSTGSTAPKPTSTPMLTGNPAAGSSPSDDPATRNPPGGNGGASGGPASATDGHVVGGGTLPGADPNSNGPASEPIEVEVETCGLPGKAPCKIDESGTPNGAGVTAAANAAKSAGTAVEGAVTNVQKPSSLGWNFGLTIPQGACSEFQFYKPGGTWQTSLCSNPYVDLIRTMLAWAMAALTALYVYRRVTAAVSNQG